MLLPPQHIQSKDCLAIFSSLARFSPRSYAVWRKRQLTTTASFAFAVYIKVAERDCLSLLRYKQHLNKVIEASLLKPFWRVYVCRSVEGS